MNTPFAAPRRGRISLVALAIVVVGGAFALGWFLGHRGSGAIQENAVEVAPPLRGPVQLSAGDVASPATVEAGLIAQVHWDTRIPVRRDKYSKQFQTVAQTFTPPEGAEALTGLDVFVGYSIGTRALVQVLEVPDRRDLSSVRVIRTVQMDLFEAERTSFYPVAMEPPIPLQAGKTYGFLIEVDRNSDEVGIGLISNQDVYDGGEAWYFRRQIRGNGELISNDHAWQYQHDDLTFRARFEGGSVVGQ